MKSLLLISLLVLGATAAPQRSEVELVQPRRVSTGAAAAAGGSASSDGSGFGLTPGAGTRRVSLTDILRSLGFGGSGAGAGGSEGGFRFGRFPFVLDRRASDCDSGRFRLSDEQYQVVTECQLQRQEDTLRECILNDLEDASEELTEFLGREEYSIAGVSVSSSISLVDGEIEFSRMVSFRMCPRDEVNAVDAEAEAEEEPADDDDSAVYRPYRPVFQLPNIFGGGGQGADQSPFNFDFESAFRPFLQGSAGAGHGGLFPRIPDFDLDADAEEGDCVSETFNLPKEAFKQAKKCRYGDVPFKQCLRTALEAVDEAKDMLEFVEDAEHQIVDTAFYQSFAAINGQVTRRYRVTLERCAVEEEVAEPADAGVVPEEEEEVPEVIQGVPEEPEQPVYSPDEEVPINVEQPAREVLEP